MQSAPGRSSNGLGSPDGLIGVGWIRGRYGLTVHDLRNRNFAERSRIRQKEVFEARGILPEIEAETSRLPAGPERHDHRARSGDLKAVFDAPDADPEAHM